MLPSICICRLINKKTANMIYDKSDELNIKAVDNSLQRNGDSFDFVPGQEGKEVDVVKSVYAINDFFAE